MKVDTNTPVADLCYVLRALADFFRVLPEDSVALLECADRLELLAVENEDLRNQNHYNRVAAEARWDRIKRLEEAGDRLAYWYEPKELRQFDALNNWKQAKEDKP